MKTRSRTKKQNLITGDSRESCSRKPDAVKSATKKRSREDSPGEQNNVQDRNRKPVSCQLSDWNKLSKCVKKRTTKELMISAPAAPCTHRNDGPATSGTKKAKPRKQTPAKSLVQRKTPASTRTNVQSDKENRNDDLTEHTIQKLRAIAIQEGISTGGQKAQLEQRMQWHRRFNLISSKVKPVTAVQPVDPTEFADTGEYYACDERLQLSLKWFSNAQIWSYFIARSARQGYLKGKLLKKAAFLRNISYSQIKGTTNQIRGNCAATMRKSSMYLMKLEHNSNTITKATCECPAGQGNSAACKHLGGLMLALEEFVRTSFLQQNQTCTEVLQTWHRPPKNTDRSMMYSPIKQLYKDSRLNLLPKITDIPRKDLTRKMLNSSLNRGLRMTVHRSRYIQDIPNYFREHSYAKPTQIRLDQLENTDDDSEEDMPQEQ